MPCLLWSTNMRYIAPLLLTLINPCTGIDYKCDKQKVDLFAAGSAFPSPLYKELGPAYVIKRKFHGRRLAFKYDRATSDHGIKRMLNKDPDEKPLAFAASEKVLTPEQQNEYRHLKLFPTIAGALMILYNMPGIDNLTLSVFDLPKIFGGQVQYWDDSVFLKYNPRLKLPHERIQIVVRSDADADTDVFTSALSSVSKEWKENFGRFDSPGFSTGECCNTTKWAPDLVKYYAYRTTGMAGLCASIPFTIGYATLADAQGTGIKAAALINAMGKAVFPSVTGIQAAMEYHLKKSYGSVVFELSNALHPLAYPIASFSYLIVNASTTQGITCCQMAEIVGFVDFIVFSDFSDEVAERNSVVKISTNVANEVLRGTLRAFTCNGANVYDIYIKSLETEESFPTWIIIVVATMSVVVVSATAVIALLIYRAKQDAAGEKLLFIPSESVKIGVDTNDAATKASTISSKKKKKSTGARSEGSDSKTSRDGAGSSGSNTPASSSKADSRGGSRPTTTNTTTTEASTRIMINATYDEHTVLMNGMNLPPPRLWRPETKKLLLSLRNDIIHPYVLSLIGVTYLDGKIFTVFDGAANGTIHDVMRFCKYDMTDHIKFNFALSVGDGMRFLHRKGVVHGMLSSVTAFVDNAWAVKLAHWETHALYNLENPSEFDNIVRQRTYDDEETLIQLLYFDPDMASCRKQAADAYAFGLLVMEVYSRKLPYERELKEQQVSYEEILMLKFSQSIGPPELPQEVPANLQELVEMCIGDSKTRPSFITIMTRLEDLGTNNMSILDLMMETMESYMDGMETATTELNKVKKKMQDLLYEVLPPQVADKLFKGETVKPEYFANVTIYFSDIIGFAEMSLKSTPQEVMAFLNDLWVLFDSTLEKYDVYKADTIGDAYMVCSGLPVTNGNEHARQICLMATDLVEKTTKFKVRHSHGHKLMIRVGINSGPVITGVVGTKMPQYCVFGDTVNTASRMESTSLPMKIQVSQNTKAILDRNFKEFKCEFRGEIEVKGKGAMKTYWLTTVHDSLIDEYIATAD